MAQEDFAALRYRRLREGFSRIFAQHEGLIYAAGHDRSLPDVYPWPFLPEALGMAGVLADKDSLGAAFNPMNAWKLVRANIGGYVIAFLVGDIILSVATFVGTLVCVIGLYPATAYAYAVLGHMYGQAHRKAMESMPMDAPAM